MIVIPAAGDGKRFKEAGYDLPKHLIPLGGVPMVKRVAENVRPLDPDGWVIIADKHRVGETRGAVDTIWRASTRIDPDSPLVIANCDQLIDLPYDVEMRGDGVIFTFKSANTAHSYVETQGDYILDIVEKPEAPPSDRAISGVYWFSTAQPFLNACHTVLKQGEGELYVSEALKVMLAEGYDLYACDVNTAILGTPEDFQRYEVAQKLN